MIFYDEKLLLYLDRIFPNFKITLEKENIQQGSFYIENVSLKFNGLITKSDINKINCEIELYQRNKVEILEITEEITKSWYNLEHDCLSEIIQLMRKHEYKYKFYPSKIIFLYEEALNLYLFVKKFYKDRNIGEYFGLNTPNAKGFINLFTYLGYPISEIIILGKLDLTKL